MSEKTGIEWTDATWNCWQGCHKVSTGCKNCYMFRDKLHYGQNPNIVVRSAESTFNAPLKWAKNLDKYGHIKRIFVNSWSDFFIEEADQWRSDAWDIMRKTPQFIYQLCTKRPERIESSLPFDWADGYRNVWLLTSTENQKMADLRIPQLLKIPAVVHGISAEPLLEPINLNSSLGGIRWIGGQRGCEGKHHGIGTPECPRELHHHHDDRCKPGLNWVITGGESGPNARPMASSWADDIRIQCEAAGVAFFHKQNGEFVDAGHEEFGRLPSSPLVYINSQGVPYKDDVPLDEDSDVLTMKRVGKKRAGATLYGKIYHEFPNVRSNG